MSNEIEGNKEAATSKTQEEQKLEFVSDCMIAPFEPKSSAIICSPKEPWEAWDEGDMEAAYNELQELREENKHLKDENLDLRGYIESPEYSKSY